MQTVNVQFMSIVLPAVEYFVARVTRDFQSRLSESAAKKLKSVCKAFRVPYRYAGLANALNGLAGD
jgi:ABC-type Co2+ transport system permease subunit